MSFGRDTASAGIPPSSSSARASRVRGEWIAGEVWYVGGVGVAAGPW